MCVIPVSGAAHMTKCPDYFGGGGPIHSYSFKFPLKSLKNIPPDILAVQA